MPKTPNRKFNFLPIAAKAHGSHRDVGGDGVLRELTVCDASCGLKKHESEPLIIDEVFMNASTDAFFVTTPSDFPHSVALDGTLEIEIDLCRGWLGAITEATYSSMQ